MGFAELILNLVFPPKCANCGKLLDVDVTKRVSEPLCEQCNRHFENEKSRECPDCGLMLRFCRCMPGTMKKAQCEGLIKLISYSPTGHSASVNNVIYSVKHRKNRALLDYLTFQLRSSVITEMRVRELLPKDCLVTYMPRSLENKAEDGFDQGLAMARALSREMGIPLLHAFRRRASARVQKNLKGYERRLNMMSAYAPRRVGDAVRGKTVFLVDDIVTTGSSMSACVKMLHSMGADCVIGVCIGYTEKLKK
jgi:ComF family protein